MLDIKRCIPTRGDFVNIFMRFRVEPKPSMAREFPWVIVLNVALWHFGLAWWSQFLIFFVVAELAVFMESVAESVAERRERRAFDSRT